MNSGPKYQVNQYYQRCKTNVWFGLDVVLNQLVRFKLNIVGDYNDLTQALRDDRLSDTELLINKENIEEDLADNRNEVLRLAIAHGYFGVAKRLLSKDIVQQELSHSGHLVLFRAVDNYLKNPSAENQAFILWLLNNVEEMRETAALGGNAVLAKVAQEGSLMLYDLLIQLPSVGNRIAAGSNRVLCSAVAKGHVEMAKRLLEQPLVIEEFKRSGSLTLGHAASSGSIEMIYELLAYKSIRDQMAQRSAFLGTAILCATRKGHCEVVQHLLSFDIVKESLKNEEHLSELLLAAISRGALDVLKSYADFEMTSQLLSQPLSAKHPLCCAIINGQRQIVDYLLSFQEVRPMVSGNALVVELAFRHHCLDILDTLCRAGASLKGICNFWAPPHLFFVNASEAEYRQNEQKILTAVFRAYSTIKLHHIVARLTSEQQSVLLSKEREYPAENDVPAQLEYALGIVSHPSLPLDIAKKINSYLPYTRFALSERYSMTAKIKMQIDEIEQLTVGVQQIEI